MIHSMRSPFLPRILLIGLACLLGWPAWAPAQSGWLLTTADFRQQAGSVTSIDATGIRFSPISSEGPVTIDMDSFLQIDRVSPGLPAPSRFILYLNGGDRVAGDPIDYKDEQVLWHNALPGDLKIPLKNARALIRAGGADEPGQAPAEDRIQLANGDSVKGIVTGIAGGNVTINANGGDIQVPLDSVAWIHFALAGKPQVAVGKAFRLRLADGSILTAPTARSDGDNLVFTLADKVERRVPLASVWGIEQLNGPVSWLSSRPPDAVVQTPYFGGAAWPTRMDLTVTGKPIQFAGKTFARGIGVHAYSRIDYALDGSYEAFRTQYAIATDLRAQYADATARIKLDGKAVYEQPHVRAGTLAPALLIDLPRDAKLLTLEVDYGDATDTQDHFNWIEPALLRKKPTTPPTTLPTTMPASRPSTEPQGE